MVRQSATRQRAAPAVVCTEAGAVFSEEMHREARVVAKQKALGGVEDLELSAESSETM